MRIMPPSIKLVKSQVEHQPTTKAQTPSGGAYHKAFHELAALLELSARALIGQPFPDRPEARGLVPLAMGFEDQEEGIGGDRGVRGSSSWFRIN
jgi:hypothetical protein